MWSCNDPTSCVVGMLGSAIPKRGSGAAAGKPAKLRFGDWIRYRGDDLMFVIYERDADNGRFLVLACPHLDSGPFTLRDVTRPALLEIGYDPR